MDLKPQLLIFNKKEILIIVFLLVLVALFSFTLGIRLGKKLGVAQHAVVEGAPFSSAKEDGNAEHSSGHANEEHSDKAGDHGEKTEPTHAASDEHGSEHAAKKPADAALESAADSEWSKEVKKEKIGSDKPMPMQFPKGKKGDVDVNDSRYTLQVGSYRTVAEATEQVTQLKHAGLEAFYLEASVPGKGTWYRVGIGIFPTKDQAEKTAQKWKSEKQLPQFLVQKIGE